MSRLVTFAVTVSLGAGVLHAADWPQWQGPDRDRVSKETGLLKEWPAGGPPVVWTATGLGAGYGSMAVAGDRVFVQGMRGASSMVIALNRADGKEVWSKALGQPQDNDRGPGPRGTPTVDGDRLYVLTENGDLACLKTDGTVVWQRNILKEFGGPQLQWLISESPLVDGPHVVVHAGRPGRRHGEAGQDDRQDRVDRQGAERHGGLLVDHRRRRPGRAHLHDLHGVRGRRRPRVRRQADVPLSERREPGREHRHADLLEQQGVLHVGVRHRRRAARSDARRTAKSSSKEVYFTRNMKNHHGGVVLVDGYLYGFNDAILTCLEFATGNMMWRDRSVGKGSVTYADGHLYIQSENNVVGLAEATPAGYREKGRFDIPDKGLPSWAHPVISDGRLYVRNQDTLLAYDIKAAAR